MSVPTVSGAAAPTVVQSLNATNAPAASATAAAGVLDQMDFLQLLVASLKYQDPSEPMKTQELMAQSTAMTTVEQLLEVARLSKESFELQQRASAIGLVGRSVSYTAGESARDGVVTAVDLTGPTPVLRIGTVEVAMADVTGVSAPSTTPGSTTSGSSPSAA